MNANASTEVPPREPPRENSELQQWLHHVEQNQRPRIGVCFRNLDCFGSRISSQYLTTYLSALARPLQYFRPRQPHAQILFGFNGAIQPGEMLLVLGRPGSGCSTFLKTLSGETHGLQLGKDTVINYQGLSYDDLHQNFPGERSYLAELDVHFPELTLGQTLHFASSTRINNTQQQMAITDQEKGAARVLASLFGLSGAYNTLMGDSVVRGVSGGEKRRTSIAEAYISGAQLQCWDNSTRGLDSETANRFVQLIRNSTNALQSTVAMSLYQASESIYQQFDKVSLLYEGHQIFFGPVNIAVEYFTSLGFQKPANATSPDFLTSLTNVHERQVQVGWENKVPRTASEFAAIWAKSTYAQALEQDMGAFEALHPLLNNKTTMLNGSNVEKTHSNDATRNLSVTRRSLSTYPLSIPAQIQICLQRANLRLRNNPAPVMSNIIANSILGLIVGSAFYNLGNGSDSLMPRATLIFFATMLNSFNSASEVSLMWAQRPIVEKQNRYAFYHPFVERLASIMVDLPAKFTLSFTLHLPIYFLSNLSRTPGCFFTYWVFMLVNTLCMAMIFRMIGSMSRSRDGTMIPVSILVLLGVLYTGFVMPPPYMVPWLGWFRFINPVAYTFESLMINEFEHRQFSCTTTIPNGPAYQHISSSAKLCAEFSGRAGADMIFGADFLSLKYEYSPDHLWRNMAILLAMMVIYGIAHLLTAQYIPAQKSRGEVLIFKTAPKEAPKADIEASISCDYARFPNDTPAFISVIPQLTTINSTFYWKDISYTIQTPQGPKRILSSINGWVQQGSLTVLMGTTGAGKTTLLDVLAGRSVKGQISGDICIDGKPRDSMSGFQQSIGYVQQNDFHMSTATVREALQFSALLRQPSAKLDADKLRQVENILELLDMTAYADAIVGVPGEGLNIEQRKRLSIGVELVAKSDLVLFLDEPTSGLDSQTAWAICTLLRKLVTNGYTILCTLHQPSAQLFDQFDRLLLLKKGESIYFGEIGSKASTLIDYFESQGGRTFAAGENPAEWIMEITDTNTNDEPEVHANNGGCDWSEKWKNSDLQTRNLQHLQLLNQQYQEREPESLQVGKTNGVSKLRQLVLVTKRVFQDHWRDPMYLYTKTFVAIGLGLVNGISFYKTSHDIQGLTNILFSSFSLLQLFSIFNILIVHRFVKGRDLFEARERDAKLYHWTVFLTANIIVEAVWLTPISTLTFACWYYPIGLYENGNEFISTTERGAIGFILIWLFILWTCTLSVAFASAIQQAEPATQMAILCFWLSLLFCGILVPKNRLPAFWTFMYWVSPLHYFIESVAISGISGIPVKCSPVEILQVPLPPYQGSCQDYLSPFIDMFGGSITNGSHTNDASCSFCPISDSSIVLEGLGLGTTTTIVWRNIGILFAYVAFNVCLIFGIYYTVRVPRQSRRK